METQAGEQDLNELGNQKTAWASRGLFRFHSGSEVESLITYKQRNVRTRRLPSLLYSATETTWIT